MSRRIAGRVAGLVVNYYKTLLITICAFALRIVYTFIQVWAIESGFASLMMWITEVFSFLGVFWIVHQLNKPLILGNLAVYEKEGGIKKYEIIKKD